MRWSLCHPATVPPCHPTTQLTVECVGTEWALAQRTGQGFWSISHRQHFLLDDVWQEAYSGRTGPKYSKFPNYSWQADVK